MNDSYFNSMDFKRQTGNLTDSGVKMLFRWIGIVGKAIIDFIKEMVNSVLGK
jgi:hypothetical protein